MGERKMGNVFGVKKIIAAGLIFFVYSFIMAANDSRPERASNIEKARQLRAAGKFTESIKILENEVRRNLSSTLCQILVLYKNCPEGISATTSRI